MRSHNISFYYVYYIKLWYDFVIEEMEKPYSPEALGWLICSYILDDKYRSTDYKSTDYQKMEDDKKLKWQYADYARLVVIRQYSEIPWDDIWKDGLYEYNRIRDIF